VLVHLALGYWQYSYFRAAQFDERISGLIVAVDQAVKTEGLMLSQLESVDRLNDYLAQNQGLERVYRFDKVDRFGGDSKLDAPADTYG